MIYVILNADNGIEIHENEQVIPLGGVEISVDDEYNLQHELATFDGTSIILN